MVRPVCIGCKRRREHSESIGFDYDRPTLQCKQCTIGLVFLANVPIRWTTKRAKITLRPFWSAAEQELRQVVHNLHRESVLPGWDVVIGSLADDREIVRT